MALRLLRESWHYCKGDWSISIKKSEEVVGVRSSHPTPLPSVILHLKISFGLWAAPHAQRQASEEYWEVGCHGLWTIEGVGVELGWGHLGGSHSPQDQGRGGGSSANPKGTHFLKHLLL